MIKQFIISTFTPLSMGIVNVLVEILIQVASIFTRPLNEEENLIDSLNGITSIQYINLGTTLIFVSIRYNLKDLIGISNPSGLLEGWYIDFNSQWYNRFGSQIIVTFIVEIGVPHLTPLIAYVFFACWRKCDRRCTKDKRVTKQLIQSSYEWLYTGPEYVWDTRLAQVVCLMWVTFQYSVCLPIVVFFTLINFIGMYWVDKWLLLRFHRTPKNYDAKPVERVLYLVRFTIIFHFIFGLLVLSNEDIITNKMEFWPQIQKINTFMQEKLRLPISIDERYSSKHVVVFFFSEIALIIIIVF